MIGFVSVRSQVKCRDWIGVVRSKGSTRGRVQARKDEALPRNGHKAWFHGGGFPLSGGP